jgi:Icc-related predicted phosphoesterase
MTRGRVTRIICAADPGGSYEALERLLEAVDEDAAQAVALIGDLSDGEGSPGGYRTLFKTLAHDRRPSYFIPGPGDAPVHDYLREAANIEVAFPYLHGVHGTAAFAPGYVLFAGVGGEISDDPDEQREELERLRYPRWEPEYRLKLLRELKDYELVLLFSTPPAHKGLGTPGSDVIAELVNTYRPRVVVCGGERGTELLGRSVVVAPGSLADGHYAIADLHSHEVRQEQLLTGAA